MSRILTESQKKSAAVTGKRWGEENGHNKVAIAKRSLIKNVSTNRNTTIMRKYGTTLRVYESMLADQMRLCLICREDMGVVHVDHCHKTGKVRGLLCSMCNKALGRFKDSVERLNNAIVYLNGDTFGY